ncbi:hypothetical protein KP78_30750 [Jeotgalibacillus soli]|uniref:Uncharacterized protein n=1 Tax=Jeotgalibacillus soli TaxID=889306 RepID=A0A0C2VHY4_9BACL|nr:hypothetical protein KP78_30750 [Jeotgalibacillus soli]
MLSRSFFTVLAVKKPIVHHAIWRKRMTLLYSMMIGMFAVTALMAGLYLSLLITACGLFATEIFYR